MWAATSTYFGVEKQVIDDRQGSLSRLPGMVEQSLGGKPGPSLVHLLGNVFFAKLRTVIFLRNKAFPIFKWS